jgi:hypothetical protein
MLDPEPSRRPSAKDAAARLRIAWDEMGERPRAVTSRSTLAERAGHAGLSALFAGAAAWLVPFFPAGWPFLLGALVAMAALLNPTAGLALALAIPVLPLGNASLGLAVVYSAFAAVWLVLFWRDPRSSFLFLVGPALAPFQALALVPVSVLGRPRHHAPRRAGRSSGARCGGRRRHSHRRVLGPARHLLASRCARVRSRRI